MKIWVVAVLWAAFLLPAMAHDHGPGSWINNERLTDPQTKQWCCDLNDCREETANVQALPDGNFLILDTKEVIPHQRVIWRSPGGWWRCRYLDGTNRTRCLIGPPPGS